MQVQRKTENLQIRDIMQHFQSLLISHARLIEQSLERFLASQSAGNEVTRPEKLLNAMRHSSLNGGKRLRPFLVIESAALFGVKPVEALSAATALECIHCYSLVHDDLPAMDDDDLRRGKPTTHKEFDEATAILAGDALLTLAFEILSSKETHSDPNVRIEMVQLYAQNAGIGGMVGGQILDLAAETGNPTADEISTLQSMKTGALLRCACEAGAILGGASNEERNALHDFGIQIGQAFQLADDILDITSDAQTMGKQTGKDAGKGKGTLVELYGLEKARVMAEELLEKAINHLEPFGDRAAVLAETAKFIVARET